MKFDVIVGNPPYNTGLLTEKHKAHLKKELNEEAYEAAITRIDAAFIVKSKEKLLNHDGHMMFVWPAIWLQGGNWADFRKWTISKYSLEKMFIINEEIVTFDAATLTAWCYYHINKDKTVDIEYKVNPICKNLSIELNINPITLPYSDADARIQGKIDSKRTLCNFKKPYKHKNVEGLVIYPQLPTFNVNLPDTLATCCKRIWPKTNNLKSGVVGFRGDQEKYQWYLSLNSKHEHTLWHNYLHSPFLAYYCGLRSLDWHTSLAVETMPCPIAIFGDKPYNEDYLYEYFELTEDDKKYIEEIAWKAWRVTREGQKAIVAKYK